MPIFERFKNLFRGQNSINAKRSLPPIILFGINPRDHWLSIKEIGDGAFGKVEKVCRIDDHDKFAASKVILNFIYLFNR
jgi:hypothetical protein